MNRYIVEYRNRRLATRAETVRLVAPNPQAAIESANSVMERDGFRLVTFRKPKVRRDI